LTKNWRTSIDQYIDNAIQGSPIDTRRDLYNNIVLSGGSTLFENFSTRLQQGIQNRVNERLLGYEKISKTKTTKIDVNVSTHPY